jgi:hypothetical protein
MAGAHATMWIAYRIPDWLYFGDFDLVSKQIEMAGARSKCCGDFYARIEMVRHRSGARGDRDASYLVFLLLHLCRYNVPMTPSITFEPTRFSQAPQRKSPVSFSCSRL